MPLKLNRTLYTVNADLNTKASVESPALTGTPTAPTPAVGDNSTKLATTAFVAAAAGNLLRITTFTSSGTWTKQADVGKILVYCVGGGGGGGANAGTGGGGGTTSFGSYASASGGSGGSFLGNSSGTVGPSAGGSTGVGDVIIPGVQSGQGIGTGTTDVNNNPGHFGFSAFGNFGRGGYAQPSSSSTVRTGGAGGATSIKLLDSPSLTSTVSITIGAGGSSGGTGAQTGASGFVLIYEYGY
jgi:hypothetical protein